MALPGCRSGYLRTPDCGWALSNKPDADLFIEALGKAYEQRGRPQGLMFYSDHGSLYGSR